MDGATQGSRAGNLPPVTRYKLEAKAADWPDPAVPEGAVAGPDDPDGPSWAGDLYQERDQTDPVEAFAAFTGADGVTAWMDAAPDGTMTGWVQDGEEVYRYADMKAWAADVDGAAMTRAGELGADDGMADDAEAGAEGEEVEGQEDLEGEGDAPTDEATDLEDAEAETGLEGGDEAPAETGVDTPEGHDPNGDTPHQPTGDPGVLDTPVPEGALAEDEGMDPRDDNYFTRKKKIEGKSLAIRVTTVP